MKTKHKSDNPKKGQKQTTRLPGSKLRKPESEVAKRTKLTQKGAHKNVATYSPDIPYTASDRKKEAEQRKKGYVRRYKVSEGKETAKSIVSGTPFKSSGTKPTAALKQKSTSSKIAPKTKQKLKRK
jgi:hypothetical protein